MKVFLLSTENNEREIQDYGTNDFNILDRNQQPKHTVKHIQYTLKIRESIEKISFSQTRTSYLAAVDGQG